MATAAQPKARKYASGVTISFGLLNVIGDLTGPKVTNAGSEEKLTSICPECPVTNISTVSQFYKCDENPAHTGFTMGDLRKAKEVDGVLVPLTAEQIKEAKDADLTKNRIDVQVHLASEVEQKLCPSGNTYVFTPTAGEDLYGALLEYLSDPEGPKYALVGLIDLRGEKFMRLDLGLNGQLMLQELVWPEDLRDFQRPSLPHDQKNLDMLGQFLDTLATPFDPEVYLKKSRKQIVSLASLVAKGQPAQVAKAPAAKEDLAAQLAAALEANRAAKAQ